MATENWSITTIGNNDRAAQQHNIYLHPRVQQLVYATDC